MAKGLYFGISGVARKSKKLYFGVNNIAKKVKKAYIGVGGVARLAWTSAIPAGEVVFTSSQTWVVPEGVKVIDIFCVGGGGSGGSAKGYSGIISYGGPGGAGYTATKKSILVTPGTTIPIVVGAGAPSPGSAPSNSQVRGSDGNVSSAGSHLSAAGGKGGGAVYTNNGYFAFGGSSNIGDGGSGGGACGFYEQNSTYYQFAQAGGVDGATPQEALGGTWAIGGKGQGTTTRKFAEAGNTLYSTGGSSTIGSGGRASGAANTGNGGGSGLCFSLSTNDVTGGAGGSGVVIIRWGEQQVA